MADSLRHRTKIVFVSVNKKMNFVRVLVPEWDKSKSIRLYFYKLPDHIKRAAKPGFECTAKVNIDKNNRAFELLFEDWKI